jgi:tetratricopeptide (TPR) repeat protein
MLPVVLLTLGCPASGPRYIPDPDRARGLPSDPERLIQLADQLTAVPLSEKPPPLAKVDRAVAALENALAADPRRIFDAQWRLSRSCFLMTEGLSSKRQIRSYAVRGVEYARQARSHNVKRVEPHYFLALNMAKVAETTYDVHLVKAMVIPAKRAAKIDERYDDAGPLRFLGKVYLTAPAWPVSVGNPDKAIETLERAVKLAPVPLNRIFLGQAYYHDEEYELAEKQLRRALSDGRAKRVDERWKKEARDYLSRIAAGGEDPRNL